jgi:sucrose-6-phosphate hydrolase SacC (GH32 family)
MDFPVELTSRNTDDGLRLFAWPAREIESLWMKKHEWANLPLAPGHNPLADLRGELFDIEATFDLQAAEAVTVEIRGMKVAYDVKKQEIRCLDRSATLRPENGKIHLRLLVDRASIEIFGNHGRVYMPMGMIPDESDKSIGLFARSGAVEVRDLSVRELKSAWVR